MFSLSIVYKPSSCLSNDLRPIFVLDFDSGILVISSRLVSLTFGIINILVVISTSKPASTASPRSVSCCLHFYCWLVSACTEFSKETTFLVIYTVSTYYAPDFGVYVTWLNGVFFRIQSISMLITNRCLYVLSLVSCLPKLCKIFDSPLCSFSRIN